MSVDGRRQHEDDNVVSIHPTQPNPTQPNPTNRLWRSQARRKEAETGRKCIHLELGQPSFETPQHVLDAGVRALTSGDTKYTSAAGTARLRDAIAASYAPVEVSSAEVVVGPGG